MGEDGVVGPGHPFGRRRPALVGHGLLDLGLLLEHAVPVGLRGDPVAGVDDVRIVVAAVGVVDDLEGGSIGGAVLLGPLDDLRVEVVPWGVGHRDVHAVAGGDQERGLHRAPGAGQRAGAPREQELLAAQGLVVGAARALAVPFGPAHHVGQRLAGMEPVVGHVDDGHVSPLGVLQQHLVASAVVGDLVLEDADADAGHVAGHHLGRVLDGLPSLLIRLETAC